MEDVRCRLSDLERWQKIMSVYAIVQTVCCIILFYRISALARTVASLQAVINDPDIIVRILHAIG